MAEADTREPCWHALAPAEAVTIVASDLDRGLSLDEVARRRARYGANALPEPARRSSVAIFLSQFKSPLIYLLFGAAAIALALGERTDAGVIFFVVVLNAVIGAFQEGRAERALEALRRLAQHKALVLREGRELVVEAHEIVPGDVLLLAAGDAVAADARLIELAALQLAEAPLTGESAPISKHLAAIPLHTPLGDRRNMVYAGTYVTAGRARAVVVATALGTEIGRIATLTESTVEPKTPLERRIDEFGRYVMVAAAITFLAILGLGVLRGSRFADIFMIAVSTLVGMVPEGLPVAVTIALAVGVQRMARRRAVVRRLSAVETLGSTTVICSDKTGTLTGNEMTVTSIYLSDERQISVSGAGYVPEGQFLVDGQTIPPAGDRGLRDLLQAGALCNDARLEADEDAEGPGWKAVGDPTEIALLTCAIKAGITLPELRSRFGRRSELPFDPSIKMMATQHDSSEGPFVVIKGAPEVVLDLCATARRNGSNIELDDGMRRRIRSAADAMASGALRLLAIAEVRSARIDPQAGFSSFKGSATFLGLVGQIDPPRAEVAHAVRDCREAGIRPVLITGDHKVTALAIARELGISREGDVALGGAELEDMSDVELAERLDEISVFARVHPAQKLRIVEAYQNRGEIVAMTGDGVNDAPALVRADVGVAMGVTGTEVAKDAAKIVIVDDNFATIVAAVAEGRVVYRNIKKAVLLLLSTSAAEVLVLLLAMLLGYPPPFAAVQILWNNLVTEGVITVNLIMEPAEGDEMQRTPISPSEPLLTRIMLTRMGVMVPAIVVSTLGWFAARTALGVPAPQVQTETFTLLAICEWFNVLNCRSDRQSALNLGLLKNPWLLGGLALGNLLQVAVVFWPPLSRVLHTVPFDFSVVVALGVVGSLVLWVEEARKLALRLRDRRTPLPAPV
jgi:magnesium-transporting ATPase (P-type)